MKATTEPTTRIPARYDAHASEQRWAEVWERGGIHHYDPDASREDTFAIDTPPPTVSGSLHIGHAFSYAHTDFVARFQRMRGRNVFYPMGWDDNGLPTERRVQNLYGVRCNPSLPYEGDPDLEPAVARPAGELREISRRAFIELCQRVTREDEIAFKRLWTRLGLSVDWRQEYATIDDRCRRVAQHAFLRLLDAGHAYIADAPMMWDVGFRTAVAQAEVEDRPVAGAMHEIAFGLAPSTASPSGTRPESAAAIGSGERDATLIIATTRPELLPACVGVAVHPEDGRHLHLIGQSAITPLFRIPVPVFASELVDPQKGTGAVMVCTFGDATDVQWWREQSLPLRQVLGPDGRLVQVDFTVSPASLEPEDATAAFRRLVGKTVVAARAAIVEMLREPPADGTPAPLRGEPVAIEHAVKFYEKGDLPLEFLTTRQWFVRLLDHVPELLEAGTRVEWHPPFAGDRYRDWTANLQFDWNISRQRWFGVPIPVWCPLDGEGRPDWSRPLRPTDDALPVDPMTDCPPGYDASRRDRPGGFAADPDVFDTWVTSSLTPQITSGWPRSMQMHRRLFPFDVRPQSHEIIRTWAFYTIAQSLLHEDSIPWRNVLISGWVRDPDRKKMSKSAGNVITPESWLDRYSADAVRYWAAGARLGVDTTFDEAVLRVGNRLATKLFHASRFVHGLGAPAGKGRKGVEPAAGEGAGVDFGPEPGAITHELDLAFLRELGRVIDRATTALETFDHATALAETERFFWNGLADNYLELVKGRLRAEDRAAGGAASAAATLRLSLSVFLRLFAPFLPFVTEEIWSWGAAAATGHASIHRAPWPSTAELRAIEPPADPDSFALAVAAIGAVLRHKSDAQISLGASMGRVVLTGAPENVARLERVKDDVAHAARASAFALRPDAALPPGPFEVVEAEQAPEDASPPSQNRRE